jgi:hypothetical protein
MTLEQQDLAPQLSHSERLPRRWGCLQWGLCLLLLLLLLLVGVSLPPNRGHTQSARQAEASNNCRIILMYLKMYAAEHDGHYPDTLLQPSPKSSNEVFRQLVKEGFLEEEEEKVFSSPVSPAKVYKKLGPAPDYPNAVAAGECHWAMTYGVTEKDSGNVPLVFENPATAGWPPVWNADAAGKLVWGRSWPKGKIIIGRNDGSVVLEHLSSNRGTAVPLKPDSHGQDPFTLYQKTGRILDVER